MRKSNGRARRRGRILKSMGRDGKQTKRGWRMREGGKRERKVREEGGDCEGRGRGGEEMQRGILT